jgi:hypothetical protein
MHMNNGRDTLNPASCCKEKNVNAKEDLAWRYDRCRGVE